MSLATGDRLGPYEILVPLGVGGMGEVYRARDTRLGREVAIKVSAERFSERFEREARAIAALNHPNICHVYDVGPNYLVMELIEGPTLTERLAEGRIPFDEAIAIARQIADGVEAAHEKGIIHRDLKPGNVKIKADGTVKVLDFGLAKIGGTPTAPTDESPTVTMHETQAGVILGTAAYMSPEQARGKAVDHRSDIYAFGAVFYEMLTGERLHSGESITEVLAAVIKEEPQWDRVPAQCRRLLRKCLEKDPQKRLRHIGDVMALMNETQSVAPPAMPAGSAENATAPVDRRRGKSRFLWAAVAALLVAAVAAGSAWLLKPAAPKQVSRFALTLPLGQHLYSPGLAISPDGTHLVYSAGASGTSVVTQLYLRSLDSLDARVIPDTENAQSPVFSPDGQWIAFGQMGTVRKVSARGGPPITILTNVPGLTASVGSGMAWSRDGFLVFGAGAVPIVRVPDGGGNVQNITQMRQGELGHIFPYLLPDGKAVLFTIIGTSAALTQGAAIAVQSLKTGERQELAPLGALPTYAPTGHLLYVQGGNLMAAPFDTGNLKLTKAAVPAVEGVQQYTFSANGTLAYAPGGTQAPQLKPVWVDRKGSEQAISAPMHNYVLPRISPDGRRVAVDIEEAESQIWVYDLARESLSRLTFEKSFCLDPVWTRDGQRIIFKGLGNRLFWQPSDGSGVAEPLTEAGLSLNDVPVSASPDGQFVAFTEDGVNRNRAMFSLSLKDHKTQAFGQSIRRDNAPEFSPDGKWVAYDSTESGRDEIYVRPFPGPGGKYQISNGGGTEPIWNPKGHELFYRNREKMMAVQVTTQPAFSAGEPKVLFEGPYVLTPRSLPDYDVSPDGQRFLMLKPADAAPRAEQINIVLNWFEELKQRVPARAR
jgi:serine/threonine-protein kinase